MIETSTFAPMNGVNPFISRSSNVVASTNIAAIALEVTLALSLGRELRVSVTGLPVSV